jgi:hypothetical protein
MFMGDPPLRAGDFYIPPAVAGGEIGVSTLKVEVFVFPIDFDGIAVILRGIYLAVGGVKVGHGIDFELTAVLPDDGGGLHISDTVKK